MAKIHTRAMSVPAPWSAADFRELLRNPAVFTACIEGEEPANTQGKAGFALGRTVADECELLTLAVDPVCQRQGIGRACLNTFDTMAAKRGARHLFLEVAANNDPAILLYTGAGWRETGRRKGYYKGANARIDAILMTRELHIA